ncbi:MAG: S1C family serine protease [Caldilineaceae bacterium]
MQQQVKPTYAKHAQAMRPRFLYSRNVWIVLCTLIVWLQSTATADAHPNLQQGDGAVTTLADVRQAVIQIEAVGTFREPEAGVRTSAAGRGSGFIIDPSGTAVTNNHVVTGAAYLQVYVAGEDRPRNARVLGVSECSDLAVIDIEGDGFPYLTWYPDPIQVALTVYAAGFPLGDPEYTLTDGIVAKERATGDSSWASVDGVVQHSAIINPGNSGGPLVDSQGRVVAINYAGIASNDQYFAISRDTAQPVIEALRQGRDLNSLGINGQALVFGDNREYSGIWVSSIKSGSPAGQVGLQPGDLVLEIEGIPMATDGTMASYCDILRSHGDNDVLNLTVVRLDTEQVLSGQIRGRPLTATTAESTTPTPAATRAPAATTGYQVIADRSGIVRFEAPHTWQEIDEQAMAEAGEEYGIYLAASPDLDRWAGGWQTPGIAVVVSTAQYQAGIQSALLEFFEVAEQCDAQQRLDDLQIDTLSGTIDIWPNCAGGSAVALSVALKAADSPLVVLAIVKLIKKDDIEAFSHLLETLTLASTPSRPTATAQPTPTETVVIPSTNTPTPLPTSGGSGTVVYAIVRIAELPIYDAPDASAMKIGSAGRTAELVITGQAEGCRWLQANFNGTTGWIAGLRRNVAIIGDCTALPEYASP